MSNDVNQGGSPRTNRELMLNAYQNATVIPAFNIPHLPIMEPVAKAIEDTNAFGFIAVAACEWVRFEAKSQEAIYAEYRKCCKEPWTRLHQDHVPVIDEDDRRVDYISILKKALDLGFDSIMVLPEFTACSYTWRMSVPIFILAMPFLIAAWIDSTAMPEPPCRTRGLFTAVFNFDKCSILILA